MTVPRSTCPSCSQPVNTTPFYRCDDVPVNSVVLCHTQEQAETIARGSILLVHCSFCDFIFNAAFHFTKCVYNEEYEESQAHSEVFNAFNRELAARLLNNHRLKGKTILEIGCGKGDFLHLLCSMGECRGIGYDPAFVAQRAVTASQQNVTVYDQLFPTNYDGPQPDCIICRMTLEHIAGVHDFLEQVRQTIAPGMRPAVFFQVPDTKTILEQRRFWDIYYEHCSYFTRDSLTSLFERTGFEIISLSSDYDDQYQMLEAVPVAYTPTNPGKNDHRNIRNAHVEQFASLVEYNILAWQNLIQTWNARSKRVVLWGGGSKAVAFMTTLKISAEIHSVVDINPHKQGNYIPGTGHPVISPEELAACRPDIILAMNPVYLREIDSRLKLLKLDCLLVPLSNKTLETIELTAL